MVAGAVRANVMTSLQYQAMDDGGGPTVGPTGLSYAALAPGYDAGLLPSARVSGSGDLYSGLYLAPSLMPGRPSTVIDNGPVVQTAPGMGSANLAALAALGLAAVALFVMVK